MQCPTCGLFGPPGAQRCDCGYDFPSGLRKEFSPSLQSRTERRAFVAAPFIASGVWYLVTLASLAVMNGRLRATTDVLAMAIGAVTLGLVIAALATFFLAFPLYCIARRLSRVSLGNALGGGVLIGTFLTLTVGILEGRLWSGLFSPVHGILGGAVTAAAWWHLAGKPDQRSAPLEVRPA